MKIKLIIQIGIIDIIGIKLSTHHLNNKIKLRRVQQEKSFT